MRDGGELREMWAQVLERPIGPDTSFFLAGGTSVSAVLLLCRIHDRFGVSLTLRTFFEHPVYRDFERRLAAELP
ncbi:acyl carrier protein [Nonomuraea sp. NPDC049709]|uniref:acyl carrier protein n=1 Tax=Nonomuraea sp. NPDC049709 TaxID=3154736 RepID=UPI00341AB776